MITNALLDLVNAFLTTVRAWLPEWNWQIPADKVQGIKYELSRWDGLLPIHEVFQIVTLAFAIWGALLGFRVVKWIVEQVIAVIP